MASEGHLTARGRHPEQAHSHAPAARDLPVDKSSRARLNMGNGPRGAPAFLAEKSPPMSLIGVRREGWQTPAHDWLFARLPRGKG